MANRRLSYTVADWKCQREKSEGNGVKADDD